LSELQKITKDKFYSHQWINFAFMPWCT